MLRLLKLQPLINLIVRNILVLFWRLSKKIEQAISRWDISGKVKVEVSGTSFYMYSKCDDQITQQLYYGLEWETNELKVWNILAESAKTTLDIGANVGVYTILAKLARPSAEVYSFEPNPVNFDRLNYNLSINNLSTDKLIPLAVGDKDGTISFTVPKDDQISLVSSAVENFTTSFFNIAYKNIDVKQTSIDTFISEQNLKQIDLIKIDVEYYEEFVLKGAQNLLTQFSPVIICEIFLYEVLAGDKPESELVGKIPKHQAINIQNLLKTHNYYFYLIGSRGLLRVNDLMSTPDGGRNYLFSKFESKSLYLPYRDKEGIIQLLSN